MIIVKFCITILNHKPLQYLNYVHPLAILLYNLK